MGVWSPLAAGRARVLAFTTAFGALLVACGGDDDPAGPEYDPVAITSTALSGAEALTPYLDTLRATGGDGSYTWALSSGALPSGLELDGATGEISGVPTVTGTSTFTAGVMSGDGQAAEQALEIEVASAPPRAYVTLGDTIHVIDVKTHSLVGTVSVGSAVLPIAITPDGTRAFVGHEDGDTVFVVDLVTNSVADTVPVAPEYPTDIAITPDGAFAYVTAYEYLRVIRLDTNELTDSLWVSNRLWGSIAIDPDGDYAYITLDESVAVLDLSTNAVTDTVPVESPVDIAVTPDGGFAYVTLGYADSVAVIDLATHAVETFVPLGDYQETGIAITPDGTSAYVAMVGSHQVAVIDLATNTVTATLGGMSSPLDVALTSDGAFVYVASSDGVVVIDVASSTVITTVPLGGAWRIAMRPAG